jgi:hypothetical protein
MTIESKPSHEPPRQDILIKLLKMTTSSNDGEALTAIRKANAVLTAGGWDWDKLFARKIVIVEDPFSKIPDPFAGRRTPAEFADVPRKAPPTAPPRPAPTPPPGRFYANPNPNPTPPPRQTAQPQPRAPYSNKENMYGGWCYCCGDTVPAKGGFCFKPFDHQPKAPDKWVNICPSCNKNRAAVMRSPAPRTKPMSAAPNLHNL